MFEDIEKLLISNKIAKRKKMTKWQAMVDKPLHRKVKESATRKLLKREAPQMPQKGGARWVTIKSH